ncbi:unnamed protein product [Closterium sp. Naga37s-1]|nr:unnamed protein product [Closterium sp. Naga37s-1]
MENLSHLSALEELWVGRNKIREVRVEGLSALVKISVQSNRLTCMRGLESCTRLQELYLSNNGISTMEGLEALSNLRILDLAANAITHVQGLDTLTSPHPPQSPRPRPALPIACQVGGPVADQQPNRVACSALIPSSPSCPSLLPPSSTPLPSSLAPPCLCSLEDLWLNGNCIESLSQLMAALDDLWLNDNRIESLSQLMSALEGPKASLVTLYLERNPCVSGEAESATPVFLSLSFFTLPLLIPLMPPWCIALSLHSPLRPPFPTWAKEAGYIETLAKMLPRAEEIDSKPVR